MNNVSASQNTPNMPLNDNKFYDPLLLPSNQFINSNKFKKNFFDENFLIENLPIERSQSFPPTQLSNKTKIYPSYSNPVFSKLNNKIKQPERIPNNLTKNERISLRIFFKFFFKNFFFLDLPLNQFYSKQLFDLNNQSLINSTQCKN